MAAGHKYQDVSGRELLRQATSWFRNYWYWALAVLAGTLLVTLPKPDFSGNVLSAVLLILVYLLLVIVSVYPQQHKSNRERTALAMESKQALTVALAEHMIVVDEFIGSLLARFGKLVDVEVQEVSRPNDLILRSIENARAFVCALGTTANASFYSYRQDGGIGVLELVEKTGNGGRDRFDGARGDDESRAVVGRIECREVTWCRDVSDPAEIERLRLDGNRPRSYAAFMSVPVELSGRIVGMLSVNTTQTDFLNEHHEGYLKVLASFVAIADSLNRKVSKHGKAWEN